MISYYTSMLLLTLLLQTSKDAVWRNLITLVLVITSDRIIDTYIDYGFSFYESIISCELIYLLFLLLTVKIHKSKALLVVTLASIAWNLIYTMTDSETIKAFIYSNFSLFNLILFECLLYSNITSVRPYIVISKYLNNIKRKFTT